MKILMPWALLVNLLFIISAYHAGKIPNFKTRMAFYRMVGFLALWSDAILLVVLPDINNALRTAFAVLIFAATITAADSFMAFYLHVSEKVDLLRSLPVQLFRAMGVLLIAGALAGYAVSGVRIRGDLILLQYEPLRPFIQLHAIISGLLGLYGLYSGARSANRLLLMELKFTGGAAAFTVIYVLLTNAILPQFFTSKFSVLGTLGPALLCGSILLVLLNGETVYLFGEFLRMREILGPHFNEQTIISSTMRYKILEEENSILRLMLGKNFAVGRPPVAGTLAAGQIGVADNVSYMESAVEETHIRLWLGSLSDERREAIIREVRELEK